MDFENFEYVENNVECNFIDLVSGISQNFIFFKLFMTRGYLNTNPVEVKNIKMTPLSFIKASSNSNRTQYNGKISLLRLQLCFLLYGRS